jgi:putative ABC transport system permease protein
MFKNYLKIAWRNIVKNKTFSLINIIGLTIGLTSCFLISLYINNQLSYDSFHKNADRIYQLGTTFITGGAEEKTAYNPAMMGQAMQMEFPEIEKTTRLMKLWFDDKTLLQYNSDNGEQKQFYETKGYLADTSFLNVLTYNLKEGNAQTALNSPRSVILSEEVAQKLFGDKPALNKVITIKSSTSGEYDFKVTGVYVPPAAPSSIDARFIMSIKGTNMETAGMKTNLATDNMFYTYLLLKPGTNAENLEKKFPAFIDKYAGNELRQSGFSKKQFLMPLRKVHNYDSVKGNVTEASSITSLYILGSIALFMLVIAIINFMNLSTARSAKRASEVGIRKVLGAGKSSLIGQFIGESVLMAIMAFLLAIALTQTLLGLFSEISGVTIQFFTGQHAMLFAAFFLLSIIAGLLAGSYPAFYLSSVKPVKTLKTRSGNKNIGSAFLRKGLVVFQFVISVILIIASVVMSGQMNFIKTQNLGFEKGQQLVIPLRSTSAKNTYMPLKEELKGIPGVISSAGTTNYPGIVNPSCILMHKEGDDAAVSKSVYMNYVDDDYLKTLKIKPAAGRMFSKEFTSDENNKIIVNEECLRELKLNSAEDAVGKRISHEWSGGKDSYEIAGVVKDFHFAGFREQINPCAFILSLKPDKSYLIAHLSTRNLASTLNEVKAAWQKLNPADPFEYSFLDEDFLKNYESESRLYNLVNAFTCIAIMISCLGLFGLTAFSAEQRTKEIGIRKVLGATEINIVSLLSGDFLKLVMLAVVVSIPAGWYGMNKWLEGFAYRTQITWSVFVLAAGAAVIIALVTISFQAVKAALANPAKSIKYE